MDTEIQDSGRNWKYHQKGLRNGEVAKTKPIAIRDIAEEVGNGWLHNNYISIEYIVLQMKKYEPEIIDIDCLLNY